MSFVLVCMLIGLGTGFGIGRLSSLASPSAALAPPEPEWTFELPQLSGKFGESYRTTIQETGVAVAEVMKAHPKSVNATSALGLLFYLAHDRTGEERVWERCLELDPKNTLAYSRLVALAQQNANYQRIVDHMQVALKQEPHNTTYRSMLGSALMYLNRPEEARIQLEKNLRAGNANIDTYLLLGEVYNQLNRPEKAKWYLELFVDLAPHRADALYSLVKVCNKLGQTAQAKEYLARFEKLKAEQLGGEATREELQDHLFVPPRIAEIETFIGKAYLEHRELAQAEKFFRRAAKTSETDIESRKMMADLMGAMAKWGEAIRWTKELRKLEPTNGQHYWNEGVLYSRARLYADAERIFRDICRLEPARDSGYASLAELYLQTNQKLNEARQLAERAVELNPTARNHWLLASIAHKQKDLVTARAVLEQALQIEPDNAALRQMYEVVVSP